MREGKLIQAGGCDRDFYPDGPKTVEEALRIGRSPCPHWEKCENGFLGPDSHDCVMKMGIQVAQHVLSKKSSVAEETKNFRKANIHSPKGWIYSPNRKDFRIVPDGEETIKLIEKFVHIVLDDKNPTVPQTDDPRLKVGPNYSDVVAHATTPDGAIDLLKIQELEGRFGSNGGVGCDV